MLLQSLAHGVLTLDKKAPLFGAARRRLRVLKMRGSSHSPDQWKLRIESDGLHVAPADDSSR